MSLTAPLFNMFINRCIILFMELLTNIIFEGAVEQK